MRLDKFLSITGTASRKDSARAVRAGAVTVNGVGASKADMNVDPDVDKITFYGNPIIYRKNTYIMMNKPIGVVSATEDGREKTVIDLLPEELRRLELFPCGRLDKNTEGLMLLTDNGSLAHYLLSPKRHVSKKYRFASKFPLTEETKVQLEKGVDIGGYFTKPCQVEIFDGGGYITLTEGKYHQIKRMLEALNNKITYLERIRFGNLVLDTSLERGEWRYLTESEIGELEAHAKQ